MNFRLLPFLAVISGIGYFYLTHGQKEQMSRLSKAPAFPDPLEKIQTQPGFSLFDRLTIVDGERQIPSTFSELVEVMKERLGGSVTHLLLPKGRSAGIDGEPQWDQPVIMAAVEGQEGLTGLSGKYNLFMRYQPKAALLELISYDPMQGRYIFQTIRNFGEEEAKVEIPNQANCLSCHQNGGPILTGGLGIETNSAKPIADQLVRHAGTEVEGLATRPAVGNLGGLSNELMAFKYASVSALNRLNQNRLWANACRFSATSSAESCRADLFKEILYRVYPVSVSGGVFTDQPEYPTDGDRQSHILESTMRAVPEGIPTKESILLADLVQYNITEKPLRAFASQDLDEGLWQALSDRMATHSLTAAQNPETKRNQNRPIEFRDFVGTPFPKAIYKDLAFHADGSLEEVFAAIDRLAQKKDGPFADPIYKPELLAYELIRELLGGGTPEWAPYYLK